MMFVTKKHLSRRTFLRGAGVTIALPLLESMVPAQTPLRQTAAAPKTRFTAIWAPHGWAPLYWNGTMPGGTSSPRADFATSGDVKLAREK